MIMKKLISFGLLISSTISLAQSTIATTQYGRRVHLKKNNTWEYIDSTVKNEVKVSAKDCDLGKDYIEPKGNERLRKHAAVENDCKPGDVKFISITQSLGNGMYTLCVNGKIMKYKKIGTVFMKVDQDPFQNKN